jgi:predicted amidophosphoribosyltransferase
MAIYRFKPGKEPPSDLKPGTYGVHISAAQWQDSELVIELEFCPDCGDDHLITITKDESLCSECGHPLSIHNMPPDYVRSCRRCECDVIAP